MINTNGKFYLGRIHDPATGTTGDKPLLYDHNDLTTHAVVVGMTGSGKTGLCLDMLEEAALNDIPALMIDPKGDITNALLHFPDLLPSDFQPWINPDDAHRDGKTVEEKAEETAVLWRNGLAKWDIQPDRIQGLSDNVQFSIYTPGSTAGLPLSILASLAAPNMDWETEKEALREQISGTVTALLNLIGLKNIDPVRSREHILLANIFETAWTQGQDLDLGELIMQTQSPPFEKLGVFDVDRFFPEKDRFDLAMALNNILAAPAFQPWIEGEPLDIERLLYTADGRPRHTIFYIAHLPEAERMFFVTLFYSAVESWMRTQKGTTSLRALIYFDEIFGYLPATSNPPSKKPMLRMLKQARAFGVGMILATQNPIDIDYKALSNAGTWFIGKLGTDQDKQRLLDGLASTASGGMDRQEYDHLISAIGKRVFVLRNVHEKRPLLFQTRWAMNYLAGPATRAQIPALNDLAGAMAPVSPSSVNGAKTVAAPSPTTDADTPLTLPGSGTAPAIPGRATAYFLPNNITFAEAMSSIQSDTINPDAIAPAEPDGVLYRPVLLAQADLRVFNRKYNVDVAWQQTAVIPTPDRRGLIRWQNYDSPAVDPHRLDDVMKNGRFAPLNEPLNDAQQLRTTRTDFADWLYRETEVMVKANEILKVYAGPNIAADEFEQLCIEAAQKKADVELDRIEARYEKKIEAIEKKLSREEVELREDESELSHRKKEELSAHAGTFFRMFSKRRSLSPSLTKRRMTKNAELDVQESVEAIAEFKAELAEMAEEMERDLEEVQQKWSDVAADVGEFSVTPYKKDITVVLFGVGWLPHYLVEKDGEFIELPAYEGSLPSVP